MKNLKNLASICSVVVLSFYFLPAELLQAAEAEDSKVSLKVNLSFSRVEEQAPRVLGLEQDSQDNSYRAQKKQVEINQFYEDLESKVIAARQQREKIYSLVAYLRAQGSPVATYDYAKEIINISEQANTDYKAIVAIMGVESGFCAAPFMTYNCFGYLNGVQYSSFSDAFRDIIPKVARDYTNVYGTDFKALAEAYGIVNYEFHSDKMERYYNDL